MEPGREGGSKMKKKTSWYRAGGYSTVIFCTYTPNSVLAKRWREVEELGTATGGWRYMVVELGGRSIRSSICRFPWGVPCSDPDKCLVWLSDFTRGLEHSKALKSKSKKNALWRHCVLYHESKPVEFSMSVTSTDIDPLTRKIKEGATIIAGDKDVLLNSR